MERIKHQTSATLDRMSILQQRYRQHQEIMKAGGDPNFRRISSQADDFPVRIYSYLCHYFIYMFYCLYFVTNKITLYIIYQFNRNRFVDQSSSSDQWSNNSRVRSGSMSSGINSTFERNTNQFNRFNVQQENNQSTNILRPSHISSSVFDVNQMAKRNQQYPCYPPGSMPFVRLIC